MNWQPPPAHIAGDQTAEGWKNPAIFYEERGGILVVLVTTRAPRTSVLTSMAAAALGSKPSHTSTRSASPTLRSICTASVCVIPSKLWWFTSRILIPIFRRPSRAAAPEELTYNKWGESRSHLWKSEKIRECGDHQEDGMRGTAYKGNGEKRLRLHVRESAWSTEIYLRRG